MAATVTFNFCGTTTVITGGASGIGLACSCAIAKAGGNVVLTASRVQEKNKIALDLLEKCKRKDSWIKMLACNVDEEESVRNFFQSIQDPIHYVIHSAGISPNTELMDQTQDEWNRVLHTNTTGSFLVLKYAASAMRQNPIVGDYRGKIVVITSTNGVNSFDPISAHYDASKAAGNMLVRVAGEHLAKVDKICVNGLAPGWVNTDMNATLPQDLREKETPKIWLGRWAEPHEMAVCVMQMLTMPYLMGQVIMVDGGYR